MVHRAHPSMLSPRTWLALIGLVTGLVFGQAGFSQEAVFNPPYPRIAARPHGTLTNYTSASAFDADARHIAKHQVAILAGNRWTTWANGAYNLATLPAYIKQYNPNIKLLKYTNSNQQESNATVGGNEQILNNKLNSERGGGGNGDWWKRTTSGANINGFAGTKLQINITQQTRADAAGLHWPQWFARYWNAAATDSGDWVSPGHGLREGQWDGIFADSQYVSSGAFAPSNADYNNDGVNDPPGAAQTTAWVVDGLSAYLKAWKSLHPTWITIGQYGNMTAPNEPNWPLVVGVHDGGLIQDNSKREGQGGGWDLMMSVYRRGMTIAGGPKIVIFHNSIQEFINDNPTITSVYRWNRYGLCSALLDNGYYAVMAPGDIHPEYDEFWGGNAHDAAHLGYLGYPKDPPQTSAWSQGVYRREFDNGLVLVNPKGNGRQTVNVGTGWKRLTGSQDPVVNSGAVATSVTLDAQDAIILISENATAPPAPPQMFPVQ